MSLVTSSKTNPFNPSQPLDYFNQYHLERLQLWIWKQMERLVQTGWIGDEAVLSQVRVDSNFATIEGAACGKEEMHVEEFMDMVEDDRVRFGHGTEVIDHILRHDLNRPQLFMTPNFYTHFEIVGIADQKAIFWRAQFMAL